jgi:DNA-binding response OmpR family regulator
MDMHTATGLKTTFAMHTLMLCADVQFLGTTRVVLNQLQMTPKVVGDCDAAAAMIQAHEFGVMILDWREVDNLADFLGAVRRSRMNQECVLVAIVRDLLDLLDLRQAFAAGVHFLIHKPASVVQIERCLRAAYNATVARRRKQHREAVYIPAAVSTRLQTFAEASVVNLSEGGVGLRTKANDEITGVMLSAGDELDLHFALPHTGDKLHVTGVVVWRTACHCGVRFTYIPDDERVLLEQWMTESVERSLAEVCTRVKAACA